MEAAPAAADTALTGIPDGLVTSRTDALRVVESIELLLDAGQWQAADSMYQARSGSSSSGNLVWLSLPAARLGQRAATAFAGMAARRDACAASLSHARMSFYVNEAGLFAMYAGDLATAREHLSAAAQHCRDASDINGLSSSLQNLARCLGQGGQLSAAQQAATEALHAAESDGTWEQICYSRTCLGWLAGLSGDTTQAEDHFTAADQIEAGNDPDGNHLCSLRGSQWAEWLARTARPGH